MWQLLKRYIELNVDNLRLTSTEILSSILASIAFYLVATAIAMASLGFLSVGLINLLAKILSFYWAFIIIAAFYALLFVIIIVFKKHLFFNPITRYISKLIVKPPKEL